ncbi:MAG: hypothetical protein H6Q05_3695, partial [Acidobacteria bacterium]|nr:hypothetical protein [Acidobacteriota bacterium]
PKIQSLYRARIDFISSPARTSRLPPLPSPRRFPDLVRFAELRVAVPVINASGPALTCRYPQIMSFQAEIGWGGIPRRANKAIKSITATDCTDFTEQPMAATRLSDHSWKWHNRNWYHNRYRDRSRHHRAAGINTEAPDHALFSIAIATAIAIPMPTPYFHGPGKIFPFWQGLSCEQYITIAL